MKKLFVLNKNAGHNDLNKFKEKIIKIYREYNRENELEVFISNSIEDTKNRLREYSKIEGKKVVIAVGGDGTIGTMASLLSDADMALGLIPMGTANDFAKVFNYENFKIEDTFNPRIEPIDYMIINGEKCINVMSLGFDTHVLKNSYSFLEKNKKLGKKAFILGVIKSLFNVKYENLEIEFDNGEFRKGEYLISALCNGGYYGSGYNPAPNSKLNDGLLDLILIDKIPLLKMLPLISRYKKGEHIDHKAVEELKVKKGKIKSETELLYNIDGTILTSKEIEFEIVENGLLWAYFS